MAETHLVQGIPNNFIKKLIYIYIYLYIYLMTF